MNLLTVAEILRKEAQENNAIVLDKQILPASELERIHAVFMLKKGENLTVNGVAPRDIPDPVDNSLTITAGTASLLNQENIQMKLIFSINDNQEAQVVIQATMSSSWTFEDSFEELVQFPFDKLSVSDVCFIYSPSPQLAYSPWKDKSLEMIKLETGLNLASWLSLKGFNAIVDLLSSIIAPNQSFKFFGLFEPYRGSQYPVGSLSALLSLKDFSIGYSPLNITLGLPEFSVQITMQEDSMLDEEENPMPKISFNLIATSSLGLDFNLGITSTGDALTFGATPFAGEPFTAAKIMQLPGGSNFESYIPAVIKDIFAAVGLNYFELVMLTGEKKVGYIELAIATVKPWIVIPSVITMESLVLQINLTDPASKDSLKEITLSSTSKILPKIFKDDFSFSTTIQKNGNNPWQVAFINGAYAGEVKLYDIVNALVGGVVSIPKELKDVVFSNFGISVDNVSNSYVCFGNCDFSFPILGSEVNSTLSINIKYLNETYAVILYGSISIGEQNFTFELDFSKNKDKKDIKLTATWQAQNESYLQFEDITSAFTLEIPKIPKELDLALKSATLYYDFTSKVAVINAVSANYGNAIFIASKPKQEWTYVFGIHVVLKNIDLAHLPIIGPDLKSLVGNVGIDDIEVVISASNLTETEVENLNKLISELADKDAPKIPETPGGILPGAYAAIKLKLGDSNSYQLHVSTAKAKKTNTTLNIDEPSSLPALQDDDNKDMNVSWINLQKAIGPVYFNKAGVAYQDGKLYLMLDASLVLSALQIGLIELGVGNPLNKFDPSFTLGGLTVGFQSGPVSISGGFLRKEIDGITQYIGAASISVKSINISALGAYATYQGHPSLFIFALLSSPPLGGPPAFFVTGVAAGFGYNRALKLPTIDEVADFPLTSGFVPGKKNPFSGGDPNAALKVLMEKNVVPIQIGQYWLAAGIQFTSFQLLKSYALLAVQFGTKLEIGLIGMSTLSIPPESPQVLAQAQLALLVRILPDEGLIAVDAKLTQASYVISKSCRLVGGFAFYVWTDPNIHAGDFVVTLGGYHPDFVPPDHYPKVPRLGFNWVVTSEISIKGAMYFALTPSCLMAGGSLQATFQSGDLKAWFIIGADFIIAWKPFHYKAAMYLNFGVSYSFSLDLLFTTVRVTISVSLGADLTVWGPEFSGVAHIHLWIVSFTVSFGNTPNAAPLPITWDDFRKTFMPAELSKPALQRQLMALKDDNIMTDTYCVSKVQRGLVEDLSAKKDIHETMDWIVNRNQTTFVTSTILPSKQYKLEIRDKNGSVVPGDRIIITNPDKLNDRNVDFGVGMVNVNNGDLTSMHNVVLEYDEILNDQIYYQVRAVLGSVPKSLWKNEEADYKKESTIDNVLLGFEITPLAPAPKVTRPIKLEYFAYHFNNFTGSLIPAAPQKVAGPELPDPMHVMQSTIASDRVIETRKKILDNLKNRNISVNTDVSVEQLASSGNDFLLAPPVLEYTYWKKAG